MRSRYLTAREAADQLDISVATLYSYVSRGLIRSEAAEGTGRQRRYYNEDIIWLKKRQEARANPEKWAEDVLFWGTPVLESGISLIDDGKLYYRGVDALELAKTASVEQVAGLLWLGELEGGPPLFMEAAPAGNLIASEAHDLVRSGAFVQAFQIALAQAAAADVASYDLRSDSVARTGARILSLLVKIASGKAISGDNLVSALQQGWLPENPEPGNLIRQTLILVADHELNVSAFTARCVASARATPYAVVIAGLSALQGTRHGGNTERVTALFEEIETSGDAGEALAARLRRGEAIPGFGHQLYPDGDPRGAALIEALATQCPDSPAVELGLEIVRQSHRLTHLDPSVDFGLVLLAHALGLPKGAPMALFALGRTLGWIGHAIEQYQLEVMIRPRARYTGPLP